MSKVCPLLVLTAANLCGAGIVHRTAGGHFTNALTEVSRRHGGAECQTTAGFPTQDDVLARIDSSNLHDFAEFGGLVINWLGDGAEYMMVLSDAAGRIGDPCNKTAPPNLYVSTDYGSFFKPATGISEVIGSATFSEVPDAEGFYLGLATPAGSCGGSDNYIYVTRARSSRIPPDLRFTKVQTGETRFGELIPHYAAHDKFIGMAPASGDGAGVAAYVCQVGSGQSAACVMLGSAVLSAVWSTSDAGTVFHTTASETDPATYDVWRYTASTGANVVLRRGCDSFKQTGGHLYVTDPPLAGDIWNEKVLWVSDDDGTTFSKTSFPFKGRNNHFLIASNLLSEQVFVAVEHVKTRKAGNTYILAQLGGVLLNITGTRALFSEPITNPDADYLLYAPQLDQLGCDGIKDNRGAPYNSIDNTVILLKRGKCGFLIKAQAAQAAGAKGLIVYNTDDTHLLYMQAPQESTDFPDIPSVLINSSMGALLSEKGAGREVRVQMVERIVNETALYKQSNLYVSDSTGTEFTLSLRNVFYNSPMFSYTSYGEYVDLYQVMSLPGTYIANYVNAGNTVSVISHNSGAHWKTLTVPEDLGARHCSDTEPCTLNIVLQSDAANNNWPLPKSEPNAVGLILATGMVAGTDVPYTLVSRDGGDTWHQVPDSLPTDGRSLVLFDYKILNHGAVLAFIPHNNLTTSVYFALDEAQSGNVMEFNFFDRGVLEPPTKPIEVQAIVTEPGAASAVLFVYFYFNGTWKGAKLDFAQNVLSTLCTATDYETWSPLNGKCLLGAVREYRRRKPCKVCNPSSVDSATGGAATPCPCTQADFKCGPGFSRPSIGNLEAPCTIDHDASSSEIACQYESIGFDVCKPSGEWTGIPAKCSDDVGTGLSSATIFGIFLILTFVAVGIAMWVSPAAREVGLNMVGYGCDFCSSVYDTAVSAIGHPSKPSGDGLYSTLSLSANNVYDDSDDDGEDGEDDDDDLLSGLGD